MVDDESGFNVALLHNQPTKLAVAGDHSATVAGDWAVLVPSSVGSCDGWPFYVSQKHGGALAPPDVSVMDTIVLLNVL